MSSKRRLRRKSCEGKVKHKTPEDARRQIRLFANREGAVDVYKCSFCNFYHVGHSFRQGR